MGAVVKRHGKGAFQIRVQGSNLGCQAGLGLAFGPQQFGAELAELRRLALAPGNELATQLVFPAFQGAPHMAIGQPQRARRARNGALLCHRLQHFGQRVADQGVAGIAAERVVKLDPMHRCSYRWRLIRCIR